MSQENSLGEAVLPPPVFFSVEAADGWLMLGSPADALAELADVPEEFRHDPRILAREWKAAQGAGDHVRAGRASGELCELLPDSAGPWICHANALRETEGLRAAADLLLSVVDRFLGEPVLCYNLACYLAQLRDYAGASEWLLHAFEAGADDDLKGLALVDPDLKPLWEKIDESLTLRMLSVSQSE